MSQLWRVVQLPARRGMSFQPIESGIGTGQCPELLIETMEEMKLTYPNPHLDVRALKKSLQAAA